MGDERDEVLAEHQRQLRNLRMIDFRDGELDDIAIEGGLFRLERMRDNAVWLAVYEEGRGEPTRRICIWIESESPVRITYEYD